MIGKWVYERIGGEDIKIREVLVFYKKLGEYLGCGRYSMISRKGKFNICFFLILDWILNWFYLFLFFLINRNEKEKFIIKISLCLRVMVSGRLVIFDFFFV